MFSFTSKEHLAGFWEGSPSIRCILLGDGVPGVNGGAGLPLGGPAGFWTCRCLGILFWIDIGRSIQNVLLITSRRRLSKPRTEKSIVPNPGAELQSSEKDWIRWSKKLLQTVDVTHSNRQIKILCHSDMNQHGIKQTDPAQNKYHLYRTLPKLLHRLCGKISFPPDGGTKLSVIEGNGTHAWIPTTDTIECITDPYMKIEWSGPVDGDTNAMSSSRGELQGQTALAIISESFLKDHNATDIPITFFTDNLGVQKYCSNSKIHRIGHHRKANVDLSWSIATECKIYI